MFTEAELALISQMTQARLEHSEIAEERELLEIIWKKLEGTEW